MDPAKITPTDPAATSALGNRDLFALSGDPRLSERQKVETLAKEFESVFVNQMLSTMRSTVQKSGFIDGGQAEELFTGMLDQEFARQMAFNQSTGLSAALTEQMLALSGNHQAAPEQDLPTTEHGHGNR